MVAGAECARKPEVFFASREDLDSFDKLFASLGLAELFPKGGRIAVKLHMGEAYSKYIVKPVFAARAVELLKRDGFKPFLTDTTTLYDAGRSDEGKYLRTAAGNGFTSKAMHGAGIVIADGNGDEETVRQLQNFLLMKTVRIARAFAEGCDGMLVLTHVKGHAQTGMGGAIKNVGMGCVSKKGKEDMHEACAPIFNAECCTGCGECLKVCPMRKALSLDERAGKIVFNDDACIRCGSCSRVCPNKAMTLEGPDPSIVFQRRLADATLAIHDALSGRIAGINFVRDVTWLCDCCRPTRMIAPDVGVFASRDIVALDQASYDGVARAAGRDAFLEETTVEGEVQMSSAQALGIGKRDYELKNVFH